MNTKKPVIMQQVLNPTSSGGVSAEFRALENSTLNEKYTFKSLILLDFHKGLNIKDIVFYYKGIKKVKPDIIQIRGAAVDSLNAIFAAKLIRGTRVLVCVHGMYSDLVYINKTKKVIAKYIIEPLIFGFSDGISFVYREASHRNKFKRYRKKILPHVYNRIPNYDCFDKVKIKQELRLELGLNTEDIIGLYCGRITKEKGLDTLIESLIVLDEEWPPNFKMLIIGDGKFLEEFKEQVSLLTNSNKIFCLGHRDDAYRYYLSSDFFIQPSLHENHSIALLEAAAAKIPIIATNVGGNKEVISNEINGILIKENEPKELFNAIKRLIFDKDFYLSCYTNLLNNSFEHFQNAEVDKQLSSVYQKLLER